MTSATSSRQLPGLIGPTLIAVSRTEAMNMEAFTRQTAPVVYLNGAILFVAGLAVVRAHNRWIPNWPIIITLCRLLEPNAKDRRTADVRTPPTQAEPAKNRPPA